MINKDKPALVPVQLESSEPEQSTSGVVTDHTSIN